MDSENNTSGSDDAAGIENLHSTAPADESTATVSPTGPVPGKQPTKAPTWTKPRRAKPPKEKQKPPRLGEKMKHLVPTFELQTNELQWTMYVRQRKVHARYLWKIHRKTKSLSCSENMHYYDEHDLDPEGNPKQKPFDIRGAVCSFRGLRPPDMHPKLWRHLTYIGTCISDTWSVGLAQKYLLILKYRDLMSMSTRIYLCTYYPSDQRRRKK